ncbi:MAG: type II toxin-antitoxin system HicA family toxin [Dethiobacteria bacterium]|jgi:predicted RNA binding protein YcfA (HicA-like mRNA interferase family)
MGEKLPVVSGKDLLDFYLKCGCELKRIKGSHHVIKSIYNESMFVIPVHSNEEIDRGLLRAIIRQSGIEVNQFMIMWKKR